MTDHPNSKLARSILTLAEHIRSEPNSIAVDSWADISSARCRSAVSRSYYAVFLAIKAAIVEKSPQYSFPTRGVHTMMLKAIGRQFGTNSLFTIRFRGLIEARERADYEFDVFARVGLSDNHVRNAELLLNMVKDWGDEAVQGLTNHLMRVEAERI